MSYLFLYLYGLSEIPLATYLYRELSVCLSVYLSNYLCINLSCVLLVGVYHKEARMRMYHLALLTMPNATFLPRTLQYHALTGNTFA